MMALIKQSKEIEAEEMQAAVQLLDDYWFFKSVLVNSSPPPGHSRTKEPSEVEEAGSSAKSSKQRDTSGSSIVHTVVASPASLRRMPTLPPRLRRQETADELAAVKPLKSCNPKLRHSLSSLDNYQSCSTKSTLYREKPSRYMKLERSERYVAIQHYIEREAYYRKIFKEKKWRSLSDLECIEVQGFKDLGFEYDHYMELLGMSTANLVNKAKPAGLIGQLRRGSGPPLFRCMDKRSAQDMKEQLEFWARAVASNARQEDF